MTAVPADQTGGEDALGAVAPAQLFSAGNLLLHPVEQQRIDYGLVAVLHIILRDLTLVYLHFLLQKVHSEALLEKIDRFDRNPSKVFHLPKEFPGERLTFDSYPGHLSPVQFKVESCGNK